MSEANVLRGLRYGKHESRARAHTEALILIACGVASRELIDLVVDLDDGVDDDEV